MFHREGRGRHLGGGNRRAGGHHSGHRSSSARCLPAAIGDTRP